MLSQQEAIRNKIDKIYLSVPQDAKYPFILINVVKLNNFSKLHQQIYEIDFEINVYARDQNHNLLMAIGEEVSKTLKEDFPHFDDYIVAGINTIQINFEQSNDLITNKINMQYKALLKKGVAR